MERLGDAATPRGTAPTDAVPERSQITVLSLPTALFVRICMLLPVDSRLACAAVCRPWRAALAEHSLWTHLDLSPESGVLERQSGVLEGKIGDHFHGDGWVRANGFLDCVIQRAGGSLESLRIDLPWISRNALLPAIAANAGALRELYTSGGFPGTHDNPSPADGISIWDVRQVLSKAPQLQTWVADDFRAYSVEEATTALCNEAPLELLRVQHLLVDLLHQNNLNFAELAAGIAKHDGLEGLTIHLWSRRPENLVALDAVVDAALSRGLLSLNLDNPGGRLPPVLVPAIARLLGGSSITRLRCRGLQVVDYHDAEIFAAALRANATLTDLSLSRNVDSVGPVVASAVLSALSGHVSLQHLSFDVNDGHDAGAVGAALGALVSANAPALTNLHLSQQYCMEMADSVLIKLLFEALPANTHLRVLHCTYRFSRGLMADVVLPAVRANSSLRKLKLVWHSDEHVDPLIAEAEQIVRDRV